MKYELIIANLIFIIFTLPITVNGEAMLDCGEGTIPDNSTGQCIPQCGEGTVPNDTKGCELIKDEGFDPSQIEYIALGIVAGLVVTGFGIFWTIKTRSDEKKREDLDLIQNYGNKLSEINQEEQNLETQLDCSLYAERYLDTLDQIASLLYKELLRREVADYFENHFKYGMNLWFWYKENLEKLPRYELNDEFVKEPIPLFEEWRKKANNKGKDKNEYFKERKESEADRWFYFRWWCNQEENDKEA
ncbi:MAG: hypothetical protein OEM79_05830 [Nitrosopumilus sp.]|nr:hypothetical protein [Nitrosopumilus sp.]